MSIQRIVLGTHTSEGEPNYLQIATVTLPSEFDHPDTRPPEDRQSELGGYGGGECKINISHKIVHEGEVNRARFMPQNPCLIATKLTNGNVDIFDYTKHPSKPSSSSDNICRPDIVCKGHTREGYGLSWSKLKDGYLISCAEDQQICLWDVCSSKKEKNILSPLSTFHGHSSVIEDVAWHSFDDTVFASVGDDRAIFL